MALNGFAGRKFNARPAMVESVSADERGPD